MSIQTPAQMIAAKMIALLEQGVRPWQRPWDKAGSGILPLRSTGQAYRGINTVLLWMEAAAMGYRSPYWMTYRQSADLGGQVRRGETGTMVVYYGSAQDKRNAPADGADGARYRFLKAFTVFNCDQIDGLPSQYQPAPIALSRPLDERLAGIEAALKRVGAQTRYGGDQAFYNPAGDFIQLPNASQFRDPEQFLSTYTHELAHYTGHSSRLNREFGKKFGDPKYQAEEAVAEITACLVGSIAGLRPDHIHDHAAYLGGWIGALKDDPNFILKVASLAQAAADYITERAEFEVAMGEVRALVASTPLLAA